MEKDFRYYFQHPWLRLIIAYLVTFCNFLIYAEDPVAHSGAECFIPVVGNCFSFVATKYPKNGWAVLKVMTWLVAILVGTVIGKLVIHKIVFSKYISCLMCMYSRTSRQRASCQCKTPPLKDESRCTDTLFLLN